MTASPFHPDELAAQARAGKSAAGAGIRDFMPDQHRDFFALLPYLFVATADATGWPLATMLTGAPGFVHAPDPVTLRIDTLPDPRDPAVDRLAVGQEIGILASISRPGGAIAPTGSSRRAIPPASRWRCARVSAIARNTSSAAPSRLRRACPAMSRR